MPQHQKVLVLPVGCLAEVTVHLLVDRVQVVRHVFVVGNWALLRVYLVQLQVQLLGVFLLVLFGDLLQLFLTQGCVLTLVDDFPVVNAIVDSLYHDSQPSDEYVPYVLIPQTLVILCHSNAADILVDQPTIVQNVNACLESYLAWEDPILLW